MNRLLGFGLALVSVSVADKPLGQYANGGAAGFGGFGGSSGGFGDEPGYESGGEGDNLEEVIPGVPGDDYPIFSEVPDTSFLCDGQVDGGYYSDPEADCQAFHICAGDGTGALTKYSFLCPNGTLFNQQYFVCDWWFNVDCSIAEDLYSLNEDIAADREANSPAVEGQGQYAGGQGGGRGGAGGRAGGRRGAASSPRGSYSAPPASSGPALPAYTFPDQFGGPGYGAPGSEAASGYGAPGRRRNARQLELETETESESESENSRY